MGDTRTPIDPQGRHGLEHLLGINGVQSNPDRVNLDTIHPVVDMSMNGYARLNDLSNLHSKIVSKTLAAPAANLIVWLLSYGNAQNPLLDDMVYPVGFNSRVIAINYSMHVPDVGGTLVGRTYRLFICLTIPDTGTVIPFFSATHQIYSNHVGLLAKQYSYPSDMIYTEDIPAGTAGNRYARGSDSFIPCPVLSAGMQIKIAVYPNCLPSPDLTYYDFPANTIVNVTIAAQHVPAGAPLPRYW